MGLTTVARFVWMAIAASALELSRGAAFLWAQGNSAVQETPPMTPPPGEQTFEEFYNSHALGRGIWKWGNALHAYQRHFGAFAGLPVDIAEIGVQSGGSLLMWQSVFGPACHVYGLDINPQCLKFKDENTTITVGDQSDAAMWAGFFAHTAKSLDILVDDGGHEPHQMLVTLTEVFPKLNPGGFISIEDIHGLNYVDSFFKKAASFISGEASTGRVASVHVYPFVLMVHKGGVSTKLPQSQLKFTGTATTVDGFEAMWAAVAVAKAKGGHVILQNAGWGPFLTEQGLINFFSLFGRLHDGQWADFPPGCQTTAAPVCTTSVKNSPMQALITGIHIFPTYLVIEVPSAPPVINAVRRGTEWITYGL